MAPQPLNAQDLYDILNGAVILGSGGGGPMSSGQGLLKEILSSNQMPTIADPYTDVDDADTMAVTFFHSPVNAAPDISTQIDEAVSAFKALSTIDQERSGRDFGFVLPIEVGAESMIPLNVGVRTGLPVIDGDAAGRAIITLTMCTYAAKDIPIAPIVLANQDLAINLYVENVAKATAPLWSTVDGPPFNGDVGMAFWAMDGKAMKSAIIPNTLTKARQLGQVLREALAAGKDPVQAVVAHLGGYLLGVGTIVADNVPTSDLAVGSLTIRSSTGEEIWVYNLRENLMAWDATKAAPLAMGPDLICYLTTDGLPFSNEDLATMMGKEIAIFAVPADPAFRIPPIIEVFMQTYRSMLNYGGPYVPFEHLLEDQV